jgi:hypothetical protein
VALVTFRNDCSFMLYLHLRVGPIEEDPQTRGSSNATLQVDDPPLEVNVGDGNVWYCYGRQLVGGDDDPPLCNAAGGDDVSLDGNDVCFASP